MCVWSQKAWTNFDETLYTTTNLESNDSQLTKYDNFLKIQDGFLGAWKTNAQYSCSVICVVKWHRKHQHGYCKTVSLVVAVAYNRTVNILVLWVYRSNTILAKLGWVYATWYKKTKNLLWKQQILIQKTLEVLSLSRPIVQWHIKQQKSFDFLSSIWPWM